VMTVNELQTVGVRRMGVPAERIFVVPHFAEVDVNGPMAAAEGHVLYVGRLAPEKGVDVLIRACAERGLPLRVVGDGRMRDELERLARALDVEVSFVGTVSSAVVAEEMRRATVLCVPSIWHEVWGLVVNEAWDAGLPVVGTEVGGLADLLRDDRGVIVPPGDVDALATALGTLVADPTRRAAIVGRARTWAAAELGRDRFVDRLKAVYRSIGVEL
jgi:glycosyltransferase involved in cell wall biosynthesis